MSVVTQACQKSGVYRVQDDIRNFKLRVKLKKVRSALQHSNIIDREEVYAFQWQAKVFSRAEVEYYSRETNCVADFEKEYHDRLKNVQEPGRLFNYVDQDDYCKVEENCTTDINGTITDLHRRMSNLALSENNYEKINLEEFDVEKVLKKCINEPFIPKKHENMFIMADLGASDGETSIWLKSEHVLCSLKYDFNNKILYVFPDFSKNEENPYVLEVGGDGKEIYEYYIEHISKERDKKSDSNEKEVIQKILKRNQEEKAQVIGTGFFSAPKNIYKVHLFFEMLTARNFEYDNIFIQYHVELPEFWKCEDEKMLTGSTQTSKMKGVEKVANFGHTFDVSFEFNTKEVGKNEIPKMPYIYFQVISRDSWDRYRCEGLCYLAIPVFFSGLRVFSLNCLRLCPKNIYGDLRRYFIGDYGNIDDVTWVGLPKDYENGVLNKYGVRTVGTGTLEVRLCTLNQWKAKLKGGSGAVEGIGSSSLVKSVQEVVEGFRRAQERMEIARKLVLERKKLDESVPE